jgi:hypothetical protein
MSKQSQKDFQHGDSDWLFSLSKFVGKKVVDVVGYPSDPFGGTPVFTIYQIVFEDETAVFVKGEHDAPYIPSGIVLKNMDEDTLQEFIDNR